MREFISNLKGVWKYIKSDKKSLIILIFEHILQIGISIVLPILSAKILIELTSNEYMRILGVAIVMLIVDLINNTNRYVMNRISARLYRNIMSRLEVHLGKCVLKIGNDSLDKNSNGVFIQRMTGDTSKLADIFNNLIGNVSSYIEYIGILVAIFVVNKLVFIYVLFFAVILYVLEDIRTKMRKQDDKEFRKSKEKVSGFIGELVRGARDIKMLNSEKDFTNELSARIDDCNEKMFSLQKRNQKYRVLMWDISSLGNFILIVLLVLLLKDKILIPSIALVLYNYSGKISSSAYFVGNFLEQIKDFNLSAERVFAITNGDEFKKEKFGNVHLDKVNGNFEFKDVTFAYDEKKILLVDDNISTEKIISKLIRDTNIKLDYVSLGKEALDKIRGKEKYDLILLDEIMDPLDGVTVMKKFKDIRNFKTNVILLTRNNEYEYNEEYLKYGFSGYLLKPISKDKLFEIIDKYLK